MAWWNLALNLCVNAPKAELLHFMVTSSLWVLLRNAIVIVTSTSSNINVQHRELYGDLHETLIIAPYILGDSILEGNLSKNRKLDYLPSAIILVKNPDKDQDNLEAICHYVISLLSFGVKKTKLRPWSFY